MHSLVAVGFKNYYFDASLPSQLETENSHMLHQQIRNIAHSHVRLEVSTMANDLIPPNEAGVQKMGTVKLKKYNGNIGKTESNTVMEIEKQVNTTADILRSV